jgi:glutamate-1-semialdehyde 2,1-aminomutase/spore coat polysaccharide biosynthesis protein SpsF
MRQTAKIVAIVQARMASTRLPGKVLADISGKTMLEHIVDRLMRSQLLQEIVVATSKQISDDRIADLACEREFKFYRGSETDVLDRYYRTAQSAKADVIVRVTADCPFVDATLVDRVISSFLRGECDYASNTLVCTYPDGLDVEVFSFAALEIAWLAGRRSADREHVTPYIRTSGRFRLRNVESELGGGAGAIRHLRWTVDEPEDLEFARLVYRHFKGDYFGWRDVLSLLDSEPWITRPGTGRIRNEGFYRSLAQEPPVSECFRTLDTTRELADRAEKVIPGGSQTLSKNATQYVRGVAPRFLAHGYGSHVWDVDGNEYVDFPMALGPVILGHCYPAVEEAVRRQLARGNSFSLPHPLEVEVAELLVELVPCAEMVRFGKNGSDATAGAVRLARAYTGRDLVICCGYHGWQDWYIGTTTFNRGVPEAVRQLTTTFEYNKIETLQSQFAQNYKRVAAVILEPVGVVEPQPSFLAEVRDLCHREGSLLIFDEVITGFRFALGGAQEYFGIVPDLACFGKAMANGYSLSAVVGRRDIMKHFEETFFSFTFAGEAIALAASIATMSEIRENRVIPHLWEQGQKLKDGLTCLAREFDLEQFVVCAGLAPRTVVSFYDESGRESLLVKSLFQQECLKRGILFSGGHNVCFSHSDADIEHTLRVYRTALEITRRAIRDGRVEQSLEGEPVQPVFRRA